MYNTPVFKEVLWSVEKKVYFSSTLLCETKVVVWWHFLVPFPRSSIYSLNLDRIGITACDNGRFNFFKIKNIRIKQSFEFHLKNEKDRRKERKAGPIFFFVSAEIYISMSNEVLLLGQCWVPLSAHVLGRNEILASLCPQVFGLYLVKLAVAMVLAGGVQRIDATGTRIRG